MLVKGSRGPDVKIAQAALIQLGYLKHGQDDGIFGSGTEAALLKWEQERYSDACISPDELDYFKHVLQQKQTGYALPALPHGQDGLIKLFGKPWEDPEDWWAKWCAEVKVHDDFSFNKRDKIYVNKYIAPVCEATFEEIHRQGLAGEIHTFDGCFNVRAIRGYEKANPPRYSTHTWAVAIDINAATNGLGVEPQLHKGVVAAFKKFGWVWGGDFKRRDGMHWQYCTGT